MFRIRLKITFRFGDEIMWERIHLCPLGTCAPAGYSPCLCGGEFIRPGRLKSPPHLLLIKIQESYFSPYPLISHDKKPHA
jgi:hypothetical protein